MKLKERPASPFRALQGWVLGALILVALASVVVNGARAASARSEVPGPLRPLLTSTPTETSTATDTLVPSDTPIPSDTPTPTDTPTITQTPRPPVTPGPCGPVSNYSVASSAGATVVPGVIDIDNHCDDCVTTLALPFGIRFYDMVYTAANISSNGNVQFLDTNPDQNNTCLPAFSFLDTIFAYWSDQRTDMAGGGIFVSTSGVAPNRVFNIEWRSVDYMTSAPLNYEVRLYESLGRFDTIYSVVISNGSDATVGVQRDTGTLVTQYSCLQPLLSSGRLLMFTQPACGTSTVTATSTATSTPTPSVTPPVCTNYTYTTVSNQTIVNGQIDIGNHCDDCTTAITLPFAVHFYDQLFTTADLSSNGNLQFTNNNPGPYNVCLPATDFGDPVMPLWEDLTTEAAGQGIFTFYSGTAPNRVFYIDWRAASYGTGEPVRFELKLYEGPNRVDFIYVQTPSDGGQGATVGLQRDAGSLYTEYSCNASSLSPGLGILFTYLPCQSATATRTATRTPTETRTVTVPPTGSATRTASVTPVLSATVSRSATIVPTSSVSATRTAATPTSCAIYFTDAPLGSTFYSYIRCLACRGIISGYPCGGPGEPCDGQNNPYFRPNNNVTRGQIAKIVSNAAGFSESPGSQIFEDVPPGNAFYPFINRLYNRGVMGGYPCGGTNPETNEAEPCVQPDNRPYFRPSNTATRGQLAKIVSNTAGYADTPTGQTFEDVGTTHPFYIWIERLTSRGVMGGYPCGGVNPETGQAEPCGTQNRPYFRPYNHVTRGQTAKIVSNTFFPGCSTPDDPAP